MVRSSNNVSFMLAASFHDVPRLQRFVRVLGWRYAIGICLTIRNVILLMQENTFLHCLHLFDTAESKGFNSFLDHIEISLTLDFDTEHGQAKLGNLTADCPAAQLVSRPIVVLDSL